MKILSREEKAKLLFDSPVNPDSNTVLEDEFCQTMSSDQREAILDLVEAIAYPKGSMLRTEGQINTSCYAVIKGLVRQYYLLDGDEKTTFFYSEGQSIFRPKGSSLRAPVTHYLSCEEDTILTATSVDKEQELFRRCPEFVSLSRTALEEELANYQEMLATFITSSPEDRYRHLLENRPELLKRVPQYHLASYLGVRPESLSRIRKRIVLK